MSPAATGNARAWPTRSSCASARPSTRSTRCWPRASPATFDFAFLDADKDRYPEYSDRLIALLRPGGLLAIDNVFWGGDVADPSVDDPSVRAIRSMNQALAEDGRVSLAMVPIADGLTLARKR